MTNEELMHIAADTLVGLAAENTILRDRLAVELMVGSPDEKAIALKTITDLRSQVEQLEAENARAAAERDQLQHEAATLRTAAQKTTAILRKLRRVA